MARAAGAAIKDFRLESWTREIRPSSLGGRGALCGRPILILGEGARPLRPDPVVQNVQTPAPSFRGAGGREDAVAFKRSVCSSVDGQTTKKMTCALGNLVRQFDVDFDHNARSKTTVPCPRFHHKLNLWAPSSGASRHAHRDGAGAQLGAAAQTRRQSGTPLRRSQYH
jgi:hypothetical protein